MRITGGYSLHQSLTIETAAIVKQAVSLARRRGHAQVTPLHVAIAMFSCPTTGLLKRACLQSHSHPLQFKALDLCFNVALNRLPTSASSSPLMASHSTLPSLSNALVAAFKRAQAHQRRGSIESQQQSVIALKVEIQQLVISVLDDPSVSRVMREAGFSSTQVKNNVEQSLSLEKCNNVVSHPATSLSQFRFPSLGRKASLSEQNLTLTLSLENSGKKAEAVVDDCKWLIFDQKVEIKKQLDCCSQCSYNFNKEAQQAHVMSTSTSKLPSWLQHYKDENTKQIHVEGPVRYEHLCKKWNSICSSTHTKKHDVSTSLTPCSSTSVSSNGLHKPDLVSNPNSSPNSASSSEDNHYMEELNSVKLHTLRETLERKVPLQGSIIPEIVSTILKCRSRIVRQASWMFFLGAEEGNDKVSIARELAKAVFGSYDCFTAIGISCFSTTVDHDDSTEEEVVSNNRKRARDENGASLYDRFAEAVSHNAGRVFYVEDADRVDYHSLKEFKKAIKDASVSVCDGGVALMRDAIVIFSCEDFKCGESEEKKCGLLDLNIATKDDDDVIGILDLVDHKVVFKMQV